MLHLRAGWQTQTKLKTSWYNQNRDRPDPSEQRQSDWNFLLRLCQERMPCSRHLQPRSRLPTVVPLTFESNMRNTDGTSASLNSFCKSRAAYRPVELFQGKTWFLADVCQIGRFLHFCKRQSRKLQQCHTPRTCRHGMTHMARFGPFIINQIMDIVLY